MDYVNREDKAYDIAAILKVYQDIHLFLNSISGVMPIHII